MIKDTFMITRIYSFPEILHIHFNVIVIGLMGADYYMSIFR